MDVLNFFVSHILSVINKLVMNRTDKQYKQPVIESIEIHNLNGKTFCVWHFIKILNDN